jgi:hypothetical protein
MAVAARHPGPVAEFPSDGSSDRAANALGVNITIDGGLITTL